MVVVVVVVVVVAVVVAVVATQERQESVRKRIMKSVRKQHETLTIGIRKQSGYIPGFSDSVIVIVVSRRVDEIVVGQIIIGMILLSAHYRAPLSHDLLDRSVIELV